MRSFDLLLGGVALERDGSVLVGKSGSQVRCYLS